MKAQFINPFIKASEYLFREYLELGLEVGKPYLNQQNDTLNEVSGIIGLAGDTTGAVVLSFQRETAIKIITIFANHKYNFLSKEVLDGVGELVNIIAGNAKKYLEDYRISISLPGVVTGKDYNIHWPEEIPVIVIPFYSDIGNFTLNISLKDAI